MPNQHYIQLFCVLFETQFIVLGTDYDSLSLSLADHMHHRLGEQTAPGEFNYDTSLAALHSYLGGRYTWIFFSFFVVDISVLSQTVQLFMTFYMSDVEDTHNRLSFLDGGAVIVVPLFYLEGEYSYLVYSTLYNNSTHSPCICIIPHLVWLSSSREMEGNDSILA